MLEKIGLPPKPALKGNEWVLDASHCQGCSSAFTFFNRKHHCRRCGGIFCGNCTQQRMILRGQGDQPVRICDPCKKLEEAARFESRYGHRNKVLKGSKKSVSEVQSDLLIKEIFSDGSGSSRAGPEPGIGSTSVGLENIPEAEEAGNDSDPKVIVTPEMLLQQAQEQKKQWLAFKKEGKNEAALQAFKRGKELERQAEDLKISIRRTQKRAANSAVSRNEVSDRTRKQRIITSPVNKGEEQSENTVGPMQLKAGKKGLEEKDDLMDALRDIGWSDAELQDTGGKQKNPRSVESELAEIAASMHLADTKDHKGSVSSMEVLAHKRRALALKREGNLAEAKEELKKAKLLERQIEEQELAGGEESEDELSAVIRAMEMEGSSGPMHSVNLDVNSLSLVGFDNDHETEDGGTEISDSDMNDPEMLAALRSMGWDEEAATMERNMPKMTSKGHGKDSLGSTTNTNLPDSDLFGTVAHVDEDAEAVHVTDEDMEDPYFLSALKAMGFAEEEPSKLIKPVTLSIPKPSEKKRLQQEISFLKKEALTLKRAGKLQEAKAELHRAKQLEREIQNFQFQHVEEDVLEAFSEHDVHDHSENRAELPIEFHLQEEEGNIDVGDEDMEDPDLMASLKSLGWQDDHKAEDTTLIEPEGIAAPLNMSVESSGPAISSWNPKSKSQLQRELLGIKRTALKLRREGRIDDAEEELRKATTIEQLIKESESVAMPKQMAATQGKRFIASSHLVTEHVKVTEDDMDDPIMMEGLKDLGLSEPDKGIKTATTSYGATSTQIDEPREDISIDDKLPEKALTHERNDAKNTAQDSGPNKHSLPSVSPAVEANTFQNLNAAKDAFHPVGDLLTGEPWSSLVDSRDNNVDIHLLKPVTEEVPERSRSGMEVGKPSKSTSDARAEGSTQPLKSDVPENSSLKQTLQQEILRYKRQALALKRDGKLAEAKEHLREAKILAKKLEAEESQSEQPSSGPKAQIIKSTIATSMLSPSAQVPLTLGKDSNRHDPEVSHSGTATRASTSHAQKYTAGKDRLKLQRESLAHKRKALALRREGKMEEAEAEFELAKSIEKQMEEIGGNSEGAVHPEKDEAGLIDEIFDPQLLSALKGLGWKETDILGGPLKGGQDSKETVPKGTRTASPPKAVNPNEERQKLEEMIKSEKVRALQLKRSGRQSEALDVLRGAKRLEKQLQSMLQ